MEFHFTPSERLKKILKVIVKVIISSIALYIVLKNIDLKRTKIILSQSNMLWLLFALIFFNFSQMISSFRLNYFFKAIGLSLSSNYNMKLYYVGMFYNLFLPGGIGGDGYKVYLLNKHHKTPVKDLIWASLLDRGTGLVSLIILALIALIFSRAYLAMAGFRYLVYVALVFILPVYYLFVKIAFPKFVGVFKNTNFLALVVNTVETVGMIAILLALHVHAQYSDYLVLFFIADIAAVIPFTIGGVGARELIFLLGCKYLSIDVNTGVAFSLIFFLITALSSFTGAFLNVQESENN
ncbi:MAG: lysylphosphatidylglycerol synthase transmembrane domain-containing protein [Bacteroidota bacterium]|nr:lysylphosphatidylglycerol synthase transmembrane domain-containing protein [Bacteroidota bacterium]MDP4274439.1 lysylphosphatidylglycerol synthase transmembrane domain-containing protein [Bacteroidota bacterium]